MKAIQPEGLGPPPIESNGKSFGEKEWYKKCDLGNFLNNSSFISLSS